MRERSLKYLITREVVTALFLVMATMSVLFTAWQCHVENQNRINREQRLQDQISRDQDSILLNIILERVDELNEYADNLAQLFPDVDFCFDLNTKSLEMKRQCGASMDALAATFNIYENRNYGVRISRKQVTSRELALIIMLSPSIWVILLSAIIIAMLLRYRLNAVFNSPLLLIEGRLAALASGDRQLPPRRLTHVHEWSSIEASLNELTSCLIDAEVAQANAGREQVAKQVLHDIRSPISALRIACQLLFEVPIEKRQLIMKAIDRIEEIANSLQFSAESGSATNIVQAIGDLVKEKQLEHLDRRVHITLHIEKELRQTQVAAPASMLKRVISNLVNNAVEACAGQGQVQIRLVGAGDLIQICILDSGKGISTGELDRMKKGLSFGKERGQGLGLRLARRMAAEWSGRLTVESVPGFGASIVLTLPIAAVGCAKPEKPRNRRAPEYSWSEL